VPTEEIVEGKKVKELGFFEKFFDGYLNRKVHKFRWPIIILGFGTAIYAAVRSTEIRGLSRMEDYFYPSHYYTIGLKKNLEGFNEGGLPLGITVDIMWGIQGINKTGVDYYNASDIGTAIWDREFDLTIGNNQQEVYNFCQYMKKLDMLYSPGLVKCWIDDFKSWLESIRQRFPVQEIHYRT
jgi:hypothetical protein